MDKSLLQQIEQIIKNTLRGVATKADLESLATKADLKVSLLATEKKLKEHINKVEMNIIKLVDKHKADKLQVQELDSRVQGIEKVLRLD